MSYWYWVVLVYLTNVCLWAGLFVYFIKQSKISVGAARGPFLFLVITSLFLTLQEIYFVINVSTNPAQAAILPAEWHPTVSAFWIMPKILLTIIALSLIVLLLREHGSLYKLFKGISLDTEVFQWLRQGLEKMYSPKATSLMLYRAGKEAGSLFAERVAEKTGVKERVLYDRIVEHQMRSGWAEWIKTEDFQIGSRVTLSTGSCFESVGRKSSSPICDFQRGFWAGICQALKPDMVCEAEEVLCRAKGDSQCNIQIKFFEKAKSIEELGSL